MASDLDVCANCPVDRGECPVCRTFWFYENGGPKRVGVRLLLPGDPYWRNPGDTGPSSLDSYAPRYVRPYIHS